MNCKNCGSMIYDDAPFCAECGAHVEKSSTKSATVCQNCSNILNNYAGSCNNCGKHVDKNQPVGVLFTLTGGNFIYDDSEFCGK